MHLHSALCLTDLRVVELYRNQASLTESKEVEGTLFPRLACLHMTPGAGQYKSGRRALAAKFAARELEHHRRCCYSGGRALWVLR